MAKKTSAALRKTYAFFFIAITIFIIGFSGCAPTYPEAKLANAVVKVCREEYGAEIEAKLAGKTLAIYIPIPSLFEGLTSKDTDASEKTKKIIDNVIFVVSRVVVSTDANLNFYVIIMQDPNNPLLEFLVIKNVMDTKRYMLSDISRNEYGKRVVRDFKVTPQFQKAQVIKELLGNGQVTDENMKILQEKILTMQAESIDDIGYWEKKFYVKDITVEEFIEKQIQGRVQDNFRDDAYLKNNFKLDNIKVKYIGADSFHLSVAVNKKSFPENSAEEKNITKIEPNHAILLEVAATIKAYDFNKFEKIILENLETGEIITVAKVDLEKLRKGKISFQEIFKKGLKE